MPLPDDLQKIKNDLKKKGTLGFKVVSGSMEPLIRTGELIIVCSAPIETLHVFDIILFWNGDRLVCHCLWHINTLREPDGSQMLITRPLKRFGVEEDLPVPSEHFFGRIVSHRIPTRTKLLLVLGAIFKMLAGKVTKGVFL